MRMVVIGVVFLFFNVYFILSRFSISSFLVLIVLFFMFKAVKFKWGKIMRILFIITGLGGGGAEKVVADLADQMVQLGHTVKIAYLKGDVIVRPQDSEVELVYLGLENFINMRSTFYAYKN